MFFYLHHGFEFVQSLGKDELYKEVQMIYLEVFAQVNISLVPRLHAERVYVRFSLSLTFCLGEEKPGFEAR